MNQQRFSIGAAALAALVAAFTGCEDSSDLIAVQLNLDRPVDVAFACYGGLRITGTDGAQITDDVETSAQPLASCDLRSAARKTEEPVVIPAGQEDLTAAGGEALATVTYLGLILQSGPGTVALAQFPADRSASYDGNETIIVDTDPLTPTKNSISVGSRPIAIATDTSGCLAVTANAGSCDLSVLDINSAMQFSGQAKVSRLAVQGINARPAAMVAQPGTTAPGSIGQTCALAQPGLVYVAYPACNAVAVVRVADGTVAAGIQFDAAGAATIVPTVSCAINECAGQIAPIAGPQPSSLDLVRDERAGTERLLIGGRKSNTLTIVNLDPATHLPTTLSSVKLERLPTDPAEPEPSALGVLDVALSPQIGMGGSYGFIDDDGDGKNDLRPTEDTGLAPQTPPPVQFQFAYAVATDGSVRVASVLPGAERECDTQLDPRYVNDVRDMATLSCFPVGEAGRPRRAGAQGPGIRPPVDAVPMAVTIIKSDRPPDLPADTVYSSGRLIGYFGVVTTSAGFTFVVDIDDDYKADAEVQDAPLAVDLSTTMPHKLHDRVTERGARPLSTPAEGGTAQEVCNFAGPGGADDVGTLRGGTRLVGAFGRLTIPEILSETKLTMLPNMQHFKCVAADATTAAAPELSFTAPKEARDDRFPDNQVLPGGEDWRLFWEGPLTNDTIQQDISGPSIRLAGIRYDGQGALKVFDNSKPYCSAGVESWDQVQLLGCNPLSTFNDCPTGLRCVVHPDSTIGIGACLPDKDADELINTCRDFLVAVRRYTVAPNPKSGDLTLLPRARVLRSTPLSGCTSDQQCNDLATYEARQGTGLHPFEDTTARVGSYSCKEDPFRAPVATGKRCMRTCDAGCSNGLSCDVTTNLCMEGPPPPAECLAGIQRYDLRASDAFTVVGGVSGYTHSIVADATGTCIKKPTAHPLQIGRIPLDAPPCTPPIPGRTDLVPNPCKTNVEHTETVPNYVTEPPAAPCTVDTANATKLDTVASTPSIFVRLAGMSFHLVNPTYAGDAQCRGDRKGSPLLAGATDIPTTFVGLSYVFRLVGGLQPLGIITNAVIPVRVLRGPQQSIWIVDEGDFLSQSQNSASTRGKVFRIESSGISVVNVMQ